MDPAWLNRILALAVFSLCCKSPFSHCKEHLFGNEAMQTSFYQWSLVDRSFQQPQIPLDAPFWLSFEPVRDPTVFGASSVSLALIHGAGCVAPLYEPHLGVLRALVYAAVEVLFLDIRNLAGEVE
jgi:hypothetical protein